MNKLIINQLLASKSLRAVNHWIRDNQFNLKLFSNCNAEVYFMVSTDNTWCIELDVASYGNRITATNAHTSLAKSVIIGVWKEAAA